MAFRVSGFAVVYTHWLVREQVIRIKGIQVRFWIQNLQACHIDREVLNSDSRFCE